MIKTIHVLNVGNYFPELCEMTFPTIESYARKIGATLNFITERKFPEWPVTYEKVQVYEDGKNSDWNILIDADVLIHSDMYDVTERVGPEFVASRDYFPASTQIRPDDYFLRDGRNIGISGWFVMASRLCHDLWSPLDMDLDKAIGNLTRVHIMDEYCWSRNLSRYGLKFAGVSPTPEDLPFLYHIGAKDQDEDTMIDNAKSKLKEWYFNGS